MMAELSSYVFATAPETSLVRRQECLIRVPSKVFVILGRGGDFWIVPIEAGIWTRVRPGWDRCFVRFRRAATLEGARREDGLLFGIRLYGVHPLIGDRLYICNKGSVKGVTPLQPCSLLAFTIRGDPVHNIDLARKY
jgi:hypothetical protein